MGPTLLFITVKLHCSASWKLMYFCQLSTLCFPAQTALAGLVLPWFISGWTFGCNFL